MILNYRASLWKSEELAKKQMRSMISYADLMKISEEETLLLTGESDYQKAAEVLIQSGVKIVVVTLGKLGAYVLNETRRTTGKTIPEIRQ